MAIYYTDNINGNDSTGDGSWANPYKSISKASSVISANGDEIRVVGGTWTALPGTVTVAPESEFITTTDDLTSYFPAVTGGTGSGMIRIINDSADYPVPSILPVFAVTSTQIDCGYYGRFQGPAQSGLTIEYLDVIHYDTYGTNPVSPDGAAAYFDDLNSNLNSYTDIEISGGWTADGVQGGVTGVSSNASSDFSRYGTFLFGNIGYRNDDLFIDNFAMVHIVSFLTNSSTSFAPGRLYFSNCSSFPFGTSNFGMWNKTGKSSYFYSNNSSLTGSANGAGGAPTLFEVNQDIEGGYTPFRSYNSLAGIRDFTQLRVQSPVVNSRPTANNTYQSSSYGTKIDTLKIWWRNGTTDNVVFGNQCYFGKVELGTNFPSFSAGLGPVTVQLGWAEQYGTPIIGDGTWDPQTVLNYGSAWSSSTIIKLLGRYYFTLIDTDGSWKTMTYTGSNTSQTAIETTDYVTGSNALKLKTPNVVSSQIPGTCVMAYPKFDGAAKTATFKLKDVDGTASGVKIAYVYDYDNRVETSISLTTSYADYTISVDPATFGGSADGTNLYFYIVFENSTILVDSVGIA